MGGRPNNTAGAIGLRVVVLTLCGVLRLNPTVTCEQGRGGIIYGKGEWSSDAKGTGDYIVPVLMLFMVIGKVANDII